VRTLLGMIDKKEQPVVCPVCAQQDAQLKHGVPWSHAASIADTEHSLNMMRGQPVPDIRLCSTHEHWYGPPKRP
jgi:hypothetical protein